VAYTEYSVTDHPGASHPVGTYLASLILFPVMTGMAPITYRGLGAGSGRDSRRVGGMYQYEKSDVPVSNVSWLRDPLELP